MKKYICDVCGKEFGGNVILMNLGFGFPPNQFTIDDGFYSREKTDADICEDCYKAIAKAQQDAIDKIKNL